MRIGPAQRVHGAQQGVVPVDAAEVGVAGAQRHRIGQPPQVLQLARRQARQLADGMAFEEVVGNGGLHVGGHRLHALLAELREAPRLVPHSSFLPPHAVGARFTGVSGEHAPPELHRVGRERFPERVPYGGRSAPRGHFGHGLIFARIVL